MFRKVLALLLTALVCACSPSAPSSVLDMRTTKSLPKFDDSDPVDWPGRTPWKYPVHGIDVAKYQGEIDWKALKRGGISFAFIKATEGGDHTDKKFRQNWINAGKVGMPRGAYHFYFFCRTGLEQARWYIRNVPKDPNALPPVLDMEWNHQSKTCKRKPSPTAIRAEMRSFLKTVYKHYGKRPVIYTTVDFYKDNHLSTFKGYEFWLRSVANHPMHVYKGQNWTFWQYSGTGRVPGIKGDTDLNVFAGSQQEWHKWVSSRTGKSIGPQNYPVAVTPQNNGPKLPPNGLPPMTDVPVAAAGQPFPDDLAEGTVPALSNSGGRNLPSQTIIRPHTPLTGLGFAN